MLRTISAMYTLRRIRTEGLAPLGFPRDNATYWIRSRRCQRRSRVALASRGPPLRGRGASKRSSWIRRRRTQANHDADVAPGTPGGVGMTCTAILSPMFDMPLLVVMAVLVVRAPRRDGFEPRVRNHREVLQAPLRGDNAGERLVACNLVAGAM